jgi:hypothetical protein
MTRADRRREWRAMWKQLWAHDLAHGNNRPKKSRRVRRVEWRAAR